MAGCPRFGVAGETMVSNWRTVGLGLLLLLFQGCVTRPAGPVNQLTVVGFNLESGDADPKYMARTVIQATPPADLWGFSELQSGGWLRVFEEAAEAQGGNNYTGIIGNTGGEDRLGILYNTRRLDYRGHFELLTAQVGQTNRAPLVAEFVSKPTGQRFLFVVNHLYRGIGKRQDIRWRQAEALNTWARAQSLPVIAVGDFNLDWDVKSKGQLRDQGFDILTNSREGAFRWIRPEFLVKTTCSDEFDSILDFVFVGGPAQTWPAASDILFPEDAYCVDTPQSSDHRPVRAVFQVPNP